MYDNCTEEVRDFGRKVRFPPANHFFLLANRTVSVSGRNTWTNTIGHISVQRMAVRNYQASLTRVVSFDTSVRCTISMVDRENSSTALTTPASAILEKGSPVKRIWMSIWDEFIQIQGLRMEKLPKRKKMLKLARRESAVPRFAESAPGIFTRRWSAWKLKMRNSDVSHRFIMLKLARWCARFKM
jgi:hypothetical protein